MLEEREVLQVVEDMLEEGEVVRVAEGMVEDIVREVLVKCPSLVLNDTVHTNSLLAEESKTKLFHFWTSALFF